MASTSGEIGMGFFGFKGIALEYERQMNEVFRFHSSWQD
jgi:hypothetical protein